MSMPSPLVSGGALTEVCETLAVTVTANAVLQPEHASVWWVSAWGFHDTGRCDDTSVRVWLPGSSEHHKTVPAGKRSVRANDKHTRPDLDAVGAGQYL